MIKTDNDCNISFHLRARALIIVDNYILLAQRKGRQMTYLPGGHIELGEKAEECLLREIKEELGYQAKIKAFLGGLESKYADNQKNHQELNLLFLVEIDNLDYSKEIQSLEPHLEFKWHPIAALENANLKPEPLIRFIKDYRQGNQRPWWGSAGFARKLLKYRLTFFGNKS